MPNRPVCCQSGSNPESQLETAAQHRIQGSLIKSRLLFLHIKHGVQTLKKILRLLPAEDQNLLCKTIYVGEWYSLAILVRLDLAIAAELGGHYPNVFEELGRFSADLNLGGAYEPLMKKDIHALLNLSAVMNKTYQDFGKASYHQPESSDPGGRQTVLLKLEYPEPPPSHYCESGLGYFQHAVELCGGQEVTVEITECLQQGGRCCCFKVEWEPPTDVSLRPSSAR
ncbi:MAG: hypothetical protein HY774_24115 [Acidobacteria bacterium]|nr:hypothetical protein [Acidobacteriota bacterium]